MIHHAFTALGLLALALGAGLWVIMTLELKHFVPPPLEKDSTLANVFARPPAPSYMHIYVFNLTNSEDWAQALTQEAAVSEVGPYVFRMETARDLHWSGENLSYKEKTKLHFEAKMSNGSLDDTIVTVNHLAMLPQIKNASTNPEQRDLILTVSIKEYFFTGFRTSELDELLSSCDSWNLLNKDHQFSWLARLNASDVPEFTVSTRSGSVNQIITVNNQTKLEMYGPSCSDLTGKIAGFGLVPAFGLSPKTLTVYEPALCVPWPLNLQEQYNIGYEPIARFHGGRSIFNATPETCTSDGSTNINGTFDAGSLYSEGLTEGCGTLPVVLSFPHFIYGDPELRTNLTLLEPSEKKHSFFIDVHARSGLVVDTRLRIQLNIKFNLTENASATIFPLFWQEISRLPDGKEKMVAAVTLRPVFAGWVALACCLSLLAAAVFLGVGILVQGPVKCWELDEDKKPSTPDDIPTDELSSESEEDLRREQRRRALRARLPAGLPVYFKIHKGDLDNLGVTIPDWVLAKIQEQIDEQSSTSSSESSSDELPSVVGSTSWSTVSSRSTSPEQEVQKNEPATELLQSHTLSPVLGSCGQEKTLTPDQNEDGDRSNGSCPPDDFEDELMKEGSA